MVGAPGTIRTCDRLVRSQVLYPAELRARISLWQIVAEREGFEPSMSFRPYALSRGAPSATRPSLPNNGAHITMLFQKIKKKLNKINTLANFIEKEYRAD